MCRAGKSPIPAQRRSWLLQPVPTGCQWGVLAQKVLGEVRQSLLSIEVWADCRTPVPHSRRAAAYPDEGLNRRLLVAMVAPLRFVAAIAESTIRLIVVTLLIAANVGLLGRRRCRGRDRSHAADDIAQIDVVGRVSVGFSTRPWALGSMFS